MIEDSSFPKGHDKSAPYPPIGTTLGEYRLEQLLARSEFGPDFTTSRAQRIRARLSGT